MKVAEGQNLFHCEYCGVYDFPDPNLDEVALLDEVSPYLCPACRKSLVSAIVKDTRIWSCPNCRGNLIAQSKMLPILRQVQKANSSVGEDPQPIPNKSELKRAAACPSCQKKMEAYPYGGPGNVIIQGCEECQLIWLDFGELSQIIRSYSQIHDRSSEELGAKKNWIPY